MALWQDLPGKNTRINRKNLSRLEMYTLATCTQNSDYKVDFDGASGLDNNDVVKISFPTALDNDKQARLSIDNGNTFYDIETLKGEDVENQEIELIFKMGEWILRTVDIKKELAKGQIGIGDDYDTDLGGAFQIWGDGYLNGKPLGGFNPSDLLDWFYPVGTIYETTSSNLDTTAKMANYFGGTWEVYGAGRVLVAKSEDTEFDTIGKTGGAKTHTLTVAQMPSHTHAMKGSYPSTSGGGFAETTAFGGSKTTLNSNMTTNSAGSGQAHNNLPPYIVIYRYRRTA